MITQSSIQRLKESIDIVDLVSNYLELKRSGANYKAKCPFHQEKTSSFFVSPTKQIFHCFGCKKGGDAIKFVMEIENLNYKEAIEKIAFLYNIPLEYTSNTGEYLEVSKVLESVQKWFKSNLEKNAQVKEYLKSRGLLQSSIEKFGIGFAPKDGLIEFLNSKAIPLPKAQEAGILSKDNSTGKIYPRFTNRITFPIYSANGLIVGFGGRTTTNHPAKYLNSPQTKLFNKSKLLYGFSIAKEHIYKEKSVIISEGYLDVIMLHQAGFKNSVATLGTALTKEHLLVLKKTKAKVILAYDGDNAGINAAFQASKMLAEDGFEGGVVLFPEGLDPADLLQKGEIKKLDLLFREAKDIVIFVLEEIAKKFDLKNPHQKEEAINETKAFFKRLSPIFQEAYLDKAAFILKTLPQYLKSSKKDSNFGDSKIFENKDLAWEEIIKTILQNERLLDEFLDILDPSMAEGYQDAIEALIKKELENPKLIEILIDETISTLDEEQFKKALLRQLERFYFKKLKEITKNQTLPYNHKSYWIRKIKTDILPRIKRGEFIVYESNIPI